MISEWEGMVWEAGGRLPERNYHFIFMALAHRSASGTGLLTHWVIASVLHLTLRHVTSLDSLAGHDSAWASQVPTGSLRL